MTTKDPRMPQFSYVSPYLAVEDVEASADFYQKAFTFELKGLCKAPNDQQEIIHGEFFYKGDTIMVGKVSQYQDGTQTPKQSGMPSPMNNFLYVDDVDQFYQHAISQGAISRQAPEDQFWGDRTCRLEDIDGYVWAFATHTATT